MKNESNINNTPMNKLNEGSSQSDQSIKLDSGNNFFVYISEVPDSKHGDINKEIVIHGDFLDNLLPSEANSQDLSISPNILENVFSSNDGTIKKILFRMRLKSDQKNDKGHGHKYNYSYLYNFEPVQVACSKSSAAILLKSEEDFSNKGKLKHLTYVFNDINMNLKNKKETFQSYFLSKITNENLFNYKDKRFDDFTDDALAKLKPIIPTRVTVFESDFQERLIDLLGKNHKGIPHLLEALKENRITEGNRLDILQFYNILKGHESSSNSKLIVIGDFVRNWYNKFENENKALWKNVYNKTLSFELPFTFLPVKQVAIGENHLLLLTIDGDIYACGDGTKGATGNLIRKFHTTPTKVIFPSHLTKIQDICAGSKHSMAIASDNMVFSWGCGACGCLGHFNTSDVFEPKQILALGNAEKIVQIDAADNYSAALTSTGHLYMWGNGQFGRLGFEPNGFVLAPTLVEDASFSGNITKIRCGYYCSLIYTNKKELFLVGEQVLSVIKNQEITADSTIKLVEEKTGIKKVIFPSGEFPIDAVCGYQFVSAFAQTQAQDVKLYTWGSLNGFNKNFFFREFQDQGVKGVKSLLNGFYQRKTKEEEEKENLFAAGKKKEIRQVWCSQNNTAILSTTGDVYVFGSFLYKITSNILENMYLPIRPKGLKVAHLALGANHILMTTCTKELFVAGRNIEGQLGLGYASHSEDILLYKAPEVLRRYGVRKCYAADNYSVVLTSNEKNRVFVFGDIPFLQNSFHINKQLTPKEMDWGNVEKVCCGSTHILLLVKDIEEETYTLKSIGNGMYGKLGNGSTEWKNYYEPTKVVLPFAKIISTKDIKLRCSRFSSGALIKDRSKEEKEHRLFLWGLCGLGVFNNFREIEESKLSSTIEMPIEGTHVVTVPYQVTLEPYKYFALNDHMHCMISSQKSELKTVGYFFGRKKDTHGKQINLEFEKVYMGLSHGAGISKAGKLFMWGSNVMNKLGIPSITDGTTQTLTPDGEDDIDNETYKNFTHEPVNVVKFNKIFEQEATNKDVEVKIIPAAIEEHTVKEPEDENKEEEIISDMHDDPRAKDDEPEHLDNIFSKAMAAVKQAQPKFDDIENLLINNELNFQKRLKEMLKSYDFLTENERSAKVLQKSIYNIFNLKVEDKPLQIAIKLSHQNWSKFPSCFVKYKENYKALLSTLHTHPCYLLKIYEHGLLDDDELYRLIKQIFSNTYDDNFSQLILITLCKGLLEIDLSRRKNPLLENFQILRLEKDEMKYNLFGRICKLLFKRQLQMIKIQEIAAMYVIGNIYGKMGSKIAECEDDLLIKTHPDNRRKKTFQPMLNTYQRNARIEKIFEHVEYFNINLLKNSNFDKNPLFSVKESGIKTSQMFRLPEMCRQLINEVIQVLKTVTPDIERIYSWLAKRFGLIIFSRFLKMIETPYEYIAVDSSIMIDMSLFQTFMTKCKDNFYSVAFAFKHCFNFISVDDPAELSDDETSKQIEKIFKNTHFTSLISSIKDILMDKTKDNNELPRPLERFDILCLKEYFKHSVRDGNYIVNCSLKLLRRLHEVIVPNLDKIRVLTPGFDFIDQILKRNNLLENGGLLNYDSEKDLFVQFKLKTKTLSIRNPQILMKCRSCKTILLHEYVLANEIMFYDEFQFISKSSSKGKFISLLKSSKKIKIKRDNIIEFLKTQLEIKKDDVVFKETLSYMLTLIAVEMKKELFLTENLISDPSRLVPLMLEQNTINTVLKKYAEEIFDNYERMKEQLNYHNMLDSAMEEIRLMAIEKKNSPSSQCELFKQVKYNCERGYANGELRPLINNLQSSAKIVQLVKYNEDMPKSNILIETLSRDMKSKLRPVKEFPVAKLFDERVVFRFLIPEHKDDIQLNPKLYTLLILKNDNFEFEMTLTKANSTKRPFWACGKFEDTNSKILLTYTLTNEYLAQIINKSRVKEGMEVESVKIGNFVEVDPKRFVQKLKKLINIGFY